MPVQPGYLGREEFITLWELLNEKKSHTPQDIVVVMMRVYPKCEPVHILETLKLLETMNFVDSYGDILPAGDGQPAQHRHWYTITNPGKKYTRKDLLQETTTK